MFDVTIHRAPGTFLEHAESWLLEREDHNNLFLSLSYARAETGRSEPDAIWAVVEQGGAVAGCAMRTPPHKVLLTDVTPVAVPSLVRAFAREFDTVPAALGPAATAQAFATEWVSLRGGTWQAGMEQGVYRLDRVDMPSGIPGGMRPARLDEVDLAVAWGEGFARDTGVGFPTAPDVIRSWIEHDVLFVWEDDGVPVSVAVAHGRTPHGMRVGYVYTPPESRRRGYASALVAALSQEMLDHGCRFCVLYTDLSNSTSNQIYQAVGYRLIAEVRDYDLIPPGGAR